MRWKSKSSRAAAVILVCFVSTAGWAQKQASRKVSPPLLKVVPEEKNLISLTLVGLPEGAPLLGAQSRGWLLDLGPVSYGGGSRNPNVAVRQMPGSFLVSTRFGLKVQDTSGRTRSVSLLAFLSAPQSRVSVRIDGVKLQAVPQPFATHLQTGRVSRHRLEVEVPTTLTEADLRAVNGISFSVVPD